MIFVYMCVSVINIYNTQHIAFSGSSILIHLYPYIGQNGLNEMNSFCTSIQIATQNNKIERNVNCSIHYSHTRSDKNQFRTAQGRHSHENTPRKT